MRLIITLFLIFFLIFLLFLANQTYSEQNIMNAREDAVSEMSGDVQNEAVAENLPQNPYGVTDEDLEVIKEIENLEMMELLQNMEFFTDMN